MEWPSNRIIVDLAIFTTQTPCLVELKNSQLLNSDKIFPKQPWLQFNRSLGAYGISRRLYSV